MKHTLRETRKKVDKTQIQIAKEVGISERGYRKIEIKKEHRSIEIALRIADALGIKTYEEFRNLWLEKKACRQTDLKKNSRLL